MTNYRWGQREIGASPDTLREAADRVEKIYSELGYANEDLPGDDWRWGLRVKVFVDDTEIGEIRAHPDGYLALFFDEGEK